MSLRNKLNLMLLPLVLNVGCALTSPVIKKDSSQAKCTSRVMSLGGRYFSFCNEEVTPEVVDAFNLVDDVKDFGEKVLGLEGTKNYVAYKSGNASKINWVYLLYVAPKLDISIGWEEVFLEEDSEYKDVIERPTIIHSFTDNLEDEMGFYSKNYDVYYRKTSNYAGGADLTPDFLKRELVHQVETFFHEDWHIINHRHVGRDIPSTINESTSTFMGCVGTIDLTKEMFGEDSVYYKEAIESWEERLEHAELVNNLFVDLERLYVSNLSLEEKLAKKEEYFSEANTWFDNNAKLASKYGYTKFLPLINDVYQKYPDLSDMADILRNIPGDDYRAAFYLQTFLEAEF